MDVLEEIIDRYTLTIDKKLMSNLKHNQATEMLNKFCSEQFSEKQADELNEIIGKLSSAIYMSSAEAGMKIGAKITVGLIADSI